MDAGAGSRVLHIAADFPNQALYPRLVGALSGLGVRQTVWSAVRTPAEAARPMPAFPGVRYDIRHLLVPAHRLLFRTKIALIVREALLLPEIDQVGLVHAHSLYSDGAAALRLQRRLKLPFIVAVRNVDLNAFMRLRPDLRWIRNAVLRAAAQVVFLSPAYRDSFLDRIGKPMRRLVAAKAAVIPNGVGPGWLDMPAPPPVAGEAGAAIRLIHVGDFSANKNIAGLLAAARQLARERAVSVTIVGGDSEQARAAGLPASASEIGLRYAGQVHDSAALRALYRAHDVFVMPSFAETFGVVYIEALSQGLPIVHSHGQGVDGYFPPGGVAEAVDPGSPDDIARGIMRAFERRVSVRADCIVQAARFDWPRIAADYLQLYERICAQARRMPR